MEAQLQHQLFNLVKEKKQITASQAAAILKQDQQQVIAALKSLEAREVLKSSLQQKQCIILTASGEKAKNNGTDEFILLQKLRQCKCIKKSEIEQQTMNSALRRKFVTLKQEGEEQMVYANEKAPNEDNIQQQLINIDKQDEKTLKMLKKSKLIKDEVQKEFLIEIGANDIDQRQETEFTQQMLQNMKDGEKIVFKPFNCNAKGKQPAQMGSLHPLNQMKERFVRILLSMGFSQMSTREYLESSFWCFDSLMIPQNHPARDLQDTFFVGGDLEKCDLKKIPQEYLKSVEQMHQQIFKYQFSEAETSRTIMRTHTTAVSARNLYEISQKMKKEGFKPVKEFSIDRVFRNENLDATHLCEFCQVEGFCIDKNISILDLMGTIKTFFAQLGFNQIKFKPAYNPYTEPSMEIFCYHDGLKKWIEVGNSGMFRAELLEALGFDDSYQCIAWGLSLERPTMIQYEINNIRDLVGPACDLDMMKNAKDCEIIW